VKPDPTETISCDHFVEFTDDAESSAPNEPEVVLIPPPLQGGAPVAPPNVPAPQTPSSPETHT